MSHYNFLRERVFLKPKLSLVLILIISRCNNLLYDYIHVKIKDSIGSFQFYCISKNPLIWLDERHNIPHATKKGKKYSVNKSVFSQRTHQQFICLKNSYLKQIWKQTFLLKNGLLLPFWINKVLILTHTWVVIDKYFTIILVVPSITVNYKNVRKVTRLSGFQRPIFLIQRIFFWIVVLLRATWCTSQPKVKETKKTQAEKNPNILGNGTFLL